MKNTAFGCIFLYIAIIILALIGEIKCIYKACNCNWEPIGKSEVMYTVSACIPPVGAIVGWIDIEDK